MYWHVPEFGGIYCELLLEVVSEIQAGRDSDSVLKLKNKLYDLRDASAWCNDLLHAKVTMSGLERPRAAIDLREEGA